MLFLLLAVSSLVMVVGAVVLVSRLDPPLDDVRCKATATALSLRFERADDASAERARFHGAAWSIEVVRRKPRTTAGSGRTRSGGRHTAWCSRTTVLTDGLVAIVPGKPFPPAALSLPSGLIQPLLEAAIAQAAGGDVGPVGTLTAIAAHPRHGLVASDPVHAGRLVTAAAWRAVDAWRGPGAAPAIILSRTGLRVARDGVAWQDHEQLSALSSYADGIRAALVASGAL